MYLTVKQQIKHLSKEDYRTIKKLCHIAKSLTNEVNIMRKSNVVDLRILYDKGGVDTPIRIRIA